MTASTGRPSFRGRQSSRIPDRLFRGTSGVFAVLIVIVLVAVGILLTASSLQTWGAFGLGFLTGITWDPVAGIYGALPFIVGTLVTATIGMLIAAPIGLLTAIFLAELAPRWLAVPLGFLVELLAAIPSVVIGLWGVFVLSPVLRVTVEDWIANSIGKVIPVFAGPSFGVGIFAAGVILAIMILPTIVSISREVINAVPTAQREAMLALGATRWETTTKAVLPFASSGIIGAVMLGLGRALGETMAVTMVIGNAPVIATSLFKPQYTMAAVIANEFTEAADELYLHALIEIGLLLFIVTIVINMMSRFLIWSVKR